MKMSLLWAAVIISVGTPSSIQAQPPGFAVLYSFTNGTDGAAPYAAPLLSGNTLYGTTTFGGSSADNGTVFALNVDGTGFLPIHIFSATDVDGFNSDGTDSDAALTIAGNTLFGTASAGGAAGDGTAFSLTTNGSEFDPLDSFPATGNEGFNSLGWDPAAGLILAGNVLYGTAFAGGAAGNGTLFALNTNGSGFSPLYSFSPADVNGYNSDGVEPYAGLIMSDNILYGTAAFGGKAGNGTVFDFTLTSNGGEFAPLYSFSETNADGLNADGASPEAALSISGNRLYGVASYGGAAGSGTIFSLNTNGTGFVTLYSFSQIDTNGLNSDGALPDGLILAGHMLYGTAEYGGPEGTGTIFSLNLDNNEFTTLYSFSETNDDGINNDGALPNGVILSGNILYGTTANGGGANVGTVFALALTPQPLIIGTSFSGTNLVLRGINGQSGQTYYVLSSTNLALPVSQWQRVATNNLGGHWAFTITATNAVNPTAAEQFYLLESQ
ncbi:MAG: choice-of-anchor tandem repeat GloVer-containing protein [Limisphaerales bacterium]